MTSFFPSCNWDSKRRTSRVVDTSSSVSMWSSALLFLTTSHMSNLNLGDILFFFNSSFFIDLVNVFSWKGACSSRISFYFHHFCDTLWESRSLTEMLSVYLTSDGRIEEHPSSFSWQQFSMWHVIVLTIARDSIIFSCRGLMKEKVIMKPNYRWHGRCRCRLQKTQCDRRIWIERQKWTGFWLIVSESTRHQGPGHSIRTTSFGSSRPEITRTSGTPWWDPALGRYTVDVVAVDRMCISKSKLHQQSCQVLNRWTFCRSNEETVEVFLQIKE